MRELGFDGLSEDKRFIVVRDTDTDEQFRVRLDESLVAAAEAPSSDSPAAVHDATEAPVEATLTPRDIQARVRRGESAQEIAEGSGMPLSQIEAFAGPVIAEREYMITQARATSVRRKHVTGVGTPLGDLVDAGISRLDVAPEASTWDSFRCEDGRWAVVVTVPGHDDVASFRYDVQSRYVLAVDDFAHELVDDVAAPVDDRNMAIADAVRTDAVALDSPAVDGDAAADPAPVDVDLDDPGVDSAELELDFDTDTDTDTGTLPPDIAAAEALLDAASTLPAVRSLKEARDRRAQVSLPVDDEPPVTADEHAPEPSSDRLEDSLADDVAVPDERPAKKRHERRRVPSWDEIMFGGPDD